MAETVNKNLKNKCCAFSKLQRLRQYYKLRGVLSTKNHQGGFHDNADESNGKMFEVKGSPRCLVQTVENYPRHLHPELSCLLQRPEPFQPHLILLKTTCGCVMTQSANPYSAVDEDDEPNS